MKINTKTTLYTHEGAKAKHINIKQQLERSVLSCLLWENTFYESGESIADRIMQLADQCESDFVADLAIKARTSYKLRHAPLLLLLALIKKGGNIVSKTIESVINRPDEMTELLALYWKDGKKPISKQMKIGLGNAFLKFSEYQLAKWNRPGDIKLRDVMFLVHPKPPKDKEELFKRVAQDCLETPNTWESRMAAGGNKKEVFTDLLQSNKLGYMALLRNLRGMLECGVDERLIKSAIGRPSKTVLPFRFISAAKHAPRLERELEAALHSLCNELPKLHGQTTLLVDTSISMNNRVSGKSELTRLDSACGLAILLSYMCTNLRVICFSNKVTEAPPRLGFALSDLIKSHERSGTYLGNAVKAVDQHVNYDRLIVITDEQSHDPVPDPKGKGYMINVASYENGVGYGAWTHIDGFSESVINFIIEIEKQ